MSPSCRPPVAFIDPVNFSDPSGLDPRKLSNPVRPNPAEGGKGGTTPTVEGKSDDPIVIIRGYTWADELVRARYDQLRMEADALEYLGELAFESPSPSLTASDQRVLNKVSAMSREFTKWDQLYDPDNSRELGAYGMRTASGYSMAQSFTSGRTLRDGV